MSDPTDGSRRGGRHSGEGGGRSAADFLASWHTGEFAAVTDEPTGPVTDGPRRARRRAEEEAAAPDAGTSQDPAPRARPSTPVPARPTSRPLDPADEEATRRTPLVAPETTEMPARPGPVRPGPARPPASALSGLILGNTGRNPRVEPATGPARSHAAPVPPPAAPVTGADGDDDGDDEPTDRHARVRDDAPGPDLFDQEDVADPRETGRRRAARHPAHDDHQDHQGHQDHADRDAGRLPDDGRRDDDRRDDDRRDDDDHTGTTAPVWDETGGLEVIGAEVEEDRGRRGRRARGARPARKRKARRPITIVLSLLVLVGLVAGIVVGGQWLLGKVNPTAEDYTGQGTGDVQVRVLTGDSLTAIGRSLVEADVIASTGPFVDAASANPAATGIQPGVYGMRLQMSGQAALDRLLDPAARLLSRVTVPEGYTVTQTLQRLSDATQVPLAELQAAAADTTQLGLPAWSNGQLEGFLYPLTYDFEPETTAVQMLQAMVAQFDQVATDSQLEARAAAAGRTPYEVLTVASMVQSETQQDAERVDVAQVVYNRLAAGTTLGIDATLAYGLDKSGNDLTVADLASDNPYNTRILPGLPPTPISSPGELSLEAALAPSTGDLEYYVLADSEGNHFFTSDYQEFLAARDRCAAAGLGCGAG